MAKSKQPKQPEQPQPKPAPAPEPQPAPDDPTHTATMEERARAIHEDIERRRRGETGPSDEPTNLRDTINQRMREEAERDHHGEAPDTMKGEGKVRGEDEEKDEI